ncbi:hypothetical protein DP42_4979 [Burkholderia pseudomallei]|nr:hypothetical protein DP42_4979 [Burkholderia pseudomallei]
MRSPGGRRAAQRGSPDRVAGICEGGKRRRCGGKPSFCTTLPREALPAR